MEPTSGRMRRRRAMQGATLIEILVSVLILSFGVLAIGNMMAYAVQLPKVAGNRAIASTLAIELSERMRANASAYVSNSYGTLSYTATSEIPEVDNAQTCGYPNCTANTLAQQDLYEIARQVRMQLPSGGVYVEPPGINGDGRIFILWKEAASAGSLGQGGDYYRGDICPTLLSSLTATAPRCVMVRFKP